MMFERERRVAGIFVGGQSRRMGSPKGLLRYEGESLVERWVRRLGSLGMDAVLVGRRPEYAHLGVPALDDDPPGIGPLGGLRALFRAAPTGRVLAVACDMPHVSDALLKRLLATPFAGALVPRRHGQWEPFLAMYEPALCLDVVSRRILRGQCSLQGLIDALEPTVVDLSVDEAPELEDWDTPTDVARDPRSERTNRP